MRSWRGRSSLVEGWGGGDSLSQRTPCLSPPLISARVESCLPACVPYVGRPWELTGDQNPSPAFKNSWQREV